MGKLHEATGLVVMLWNQRTANKRKIDAKIKDCFSDGFPSHGEPNLPAVSAIHTHLWKVGSEENSPRRSRQMGLEYIKV